MGYNFPLGKALIKSHNPLLYLYMLGQFYIEPLSSLIIHDFLFWLLIEVRRGKHWKCTAELGICKTDFSPYIATNWRVGYVGEG